MPKLLPRYRVTTDLKSEYAEKLEAIMEHEGMSQSDAIRKAIDVLYEQIVKD